MGFLLPLVTDYCLFYVFSLDTLLDIVLGLPFHQGNFRDILQLV